MQQPCLHNLACSMSTFWCAQCTRGHPDALTMYVRTSVQDTRINEPMQRKHVVWRQFEILEVSQLWTVRGHLVELNLAWSFGDP